LCNAWWKTLPRCAGNRWNRWPFIIGNFGEAVEKSLVRIAESVGAKGTIHYQDQPLGTAHAVMCAKEALEGNVVVAFCRYALQSRLYPRRQPRRHHLGAEGGRPRPFGVVKLNEQNQITEFVEKPEHFVSDLAIIGIYYFKDGAYLRSELQYLLDNDIKDKGEFQLTNALENMKNKGTRFVPGQVTEWLDCGNKDATVFTNQRYLEYLAERQENLVDASAQIVNSVVVQPVYLGKNVKLRNAVVGPHVSVGNGSTITDSVVKNAIIQENTTVNNANISNSMLGNFVKFEGKPSDLSVGDYNVILS
jgi:glucose-1-phosphate thymidylyltransferase